MGTLTKEDIFKKPLYFYIKKNLCLDETILQFFKNNPEFTKDFLKNIRKNYLGITLKVEKEIFNDIKLYGLEKYMESYIDCVWLNEYKKFYGTLMDIKDENSNKIPIKLKYNVKYKTQDDRHDAIKRQKREYYWRNLEKFQKKRGTKPYIKIDKTEYEEFLKFKQSKQ